MSDAQKGEVEKLKPETKPPNVGDFNQLGWYVLYLCITYEIMIVSQVSNLIYMIYGGAVANVVGCDDTVFSNMTQKQACAELDRLGDTCSNVKLDAAFHSVNYDFGFFCAKAPMIKLSTSVQMIGIMIGAMSFGQLSDTFGRRKTLIFGTVGLIVSGFISTFATNIYFFTISRLFVMLFTGGKHSVSYVYMMENLPTKHRMWIVTVITYSPNYLVFTALAYFTGDWRTLSRVVAGITFIPLIMLTFAKETPRWLVQKERIDEAKDVLVAISKWDGIDTTERTEKIDFVLNKERERIQQASGQPKRKYFTYHLFAYRKFAIYTILLSYSLMTTSIISYGLMFNFEKLSGSPYLNTIIIGCLRYSINIVVAIIDINFVWAGRRLLHGIAMSFMSLGLFVAFAIGALGLDWQSVLRLTALSVSAMGSQIYILNAIAPSELFPTAIRNIGMGFVQTFNRVGNSIAPNIFILGELWSPLPYLTMGLMALIEVISFELLIPETKGKPLPDRMPDEGSEDVEGKITDGPKDDKDEEQVPLNEIRR